MPLARIMPQAAGHRDRCSGPLAQEAPWGFEACGGGSKERCSAARGRKETLGTGRKLGQAAFRGWSF